MVAKGLEGERQEYVKKRIRKAVGIKALKQVRAMVDDIEVEEASNKRWSMIILSIFFTSLMIFVLLCYFAG